MNGVATTSFVSTIVPLLQRYLKKRTQRPILQSIKFTALLLVVNVGPGKSHFRWLEEYTVLKFIVLAGASLAFVSVAAAADLPRPQPVYSQAPVGKQPIGKTPVGKTPIGKTPIGKNPTLVTKG